MEGQCIRLYWPKRQLVGCLRHWVSLADEMFRRVQLDKGRERVERAKRYGPRFRLCGRYERLHGVKTVVGDEKRPLR